MIWILSIQRSILLTSEHTSLKYTPGLFQLICIWLFLKINICCKVVQAALDIISELLKQCGGSVTSNHINIDKILSCVRAIMKGECKCQDIETEEEDEEAEQDEMVFEYVEEIIPTLGKAMTPQTFAPYFAGKH